jgi:hypothetical protein
MFLSPTDGAWTPSPDPHRRREFLHPHPG